MNLAAKINKYLTPERRQAINGIIATAGIIIVALSPKMSDAVAQWTQVVDAAFGVVMLIISAIVTKTPQWRPVYAGLAALVAALVGASVLTAATGDTVTRVIFLVIQVVPSFLILSRTNTSDPFGSPDGQVIPVEANTTMKDTAAVVTATLYPDGTLLS